MYMAPKFLESISISAEKHKSDFLMLLNFKYGVNVAFAFAMGVTSCMYNKHPYSIKKSISFILDLIIGKPSKPLTIEKGQAKQITDADPVDASNLPKIEKDENKDIQIKAEPSDGSEDLQTQTELV